MTDGLQPRQFSVGRDVLSGETEDFKVRKARNL